MSLCYLHGDKKKKKNNSIQFNSIQILFFQYMIHKIAVQDYI